MCQLNSAALPPTGGLLQGDLRNILQQESSQPEKPSVPHAAVPIQASALQARRSCDISKLSQRRRSCDFTQSDHIARAYQDFEAEGSEAGPDESKNQAVDEERLRELQRAGIDVDQANAQLDRLTQLCSSVFKVPGCTLTLYAGQELVVKSKVGVDDRVPKHLSIKLAIGRWATYLEKPRLIAVADATLDARSAQHGPVHAITSACMCRLLALPGRGKHAPSHCWPIDL